MMHRLFHRFGKWSEFERIGKKHSPGLVIAIVQMRECSECGFREFKTQWM